MNNECRTLCVECGPNVRIDEDGCCLGCGASAIGHWLDNRPTIVCLCGSTRFYKAFQRTNYEKTMQGEIVLSVGFYMHSSKDAHGETFGCTPEQKIALDKLHFRKIDLADYVFVLNVDGYIGESTRNEINHAERIGKPIQYLEPIQDVQ